MDYVVSCLARYLANGGDQSVELVIAGDGPFKEELEKVIEKAGVADYVKLVGKVAHQDIYAYYFMADVLLSGSKSETQGLTVNEAMASRCLVLIRHDYNFDMIVKEGETGFFFRNSDTFATQLTKILTLSARKEAIRDEAQKANADLYSVEKFGREVTDVYRRAIRKCW
nr:Glycos_transf_1 [uncultured bacterium]